MTADPQVDRPLLNRIVKRRDEALVTIVGAADRPGVAAQIFRAVARAGSVVNMIVQNAARDSGRTEVSFTVSADDVATVDAALREARQTIDFERFEIDTDIGRITLHGAGLQGSAEVIAAFFAAIFAANVNIRMISTSDIEISIICHQGALDAAVAAATDTLFDIVDADAPRATSDG